MTDPAGRPIGGVSVVVDSGVVRAATLRDGSYRLVRVPTGSRALTFRYIGLQEARKNVTVSSDTPATINMQMRQAVTTLATITVQSQVAGQAAALNQQRTSGTITSVIDNELAGRLPDPNLAEALARVPGVAMIRDQGEGRFVQIRGTAADLNSMSIDGMRVATPEQSSRQLTMDVIPSDQAAAIQVSKTLSADMDADAIGGNVNIVTRTARAGQPLLNATLAGGRNQLGGGGLANIALNAGRRFGQAQRFGAIIGGTYYRNDRASQNFEGTWCSQDRDCGPAGSASQTSLDAPRLWELRDYPQVNRLRQGTNGTLDYLLGDQGRLFLRGTWNRFSDDEIRFRTRYGFRGGGGSRWTMVTPDSGSVTAARLDRDMRLREVIQDIGTFQFGGAYAFSSGRTVDWSVGTSIAGEDRPDVRTIVFRQTGMTLAYNFADDDRPKAYVVTGSFDDPTRFAFNSFTREVRKTRDQDLNARLSAAFPVHLGRWAGTIGVGAAARLKDRENRLTQTVSTSALGANSLNATGATLHSLLVASATGRSTFGGDYNMGRSMDASRAADFLAGNRGAFTTDVLASTLASAGGSYSVGEDVYAGYVMATLDAGSLRLIPGVRVEATRVNNTANRVTVSGATATVAEVTGSSDYVNLFPSLNATWRFDDFTNLRAAVTTSIVRPQFADMAPYVNITVGQPTAAIGNPDLDATRALAYDLMLERYFRSVGFVSAGVFYKSLDDFIYPTSRARRADEQLGPDATLVTQPVNGPSASIRGFEVAWQQNLSFLPGVLGGLGVNANYTYTRSKSTIPNRGGADSKLPGQTGNAGNIGVFFDRGPVSLRAGGNYSGEFLSTINPQSPEGDTRTRSRFQVDASGALRLANGIRLFGEFINLTNTPLRATVGDRNNRGGGGDDPSWEFYRPWGMVGIRIDR